jgi:hypothetical protein
MAIYETVAIKESASELKPERKGKPKSAETLELESLIRDFAKGSAKTMGIRHAGDLARFKVKVSNVLAAMKADKAQPFRSNVYFLINEAKYPATLIMSKDALRKPRSKATKAK